MSLTNEGQGQARIGIDKVNNVVPWDVAVQTLKLLFERGSKPIAPEQLAVARVEVELKQSVAMKYVLLVTALVAINLSFAEPARAQTPDAIPDASRADTRPRTKQERALGLEGQPRGKREKPAPADPDDDDADDAAAAPKIGQPY